MVNMNYLKTVLTGTNLLVLYLKKYLQNTNVTKNIAFGVHEDLINENKINQSIKLSNLENFVANKYEANQIYIGDKAEREFSESSPKNWYRKKYL